MKKTMKYETEMNFADMMAKKEQELYQRFVVELLEDDDFLKKNIVAHFHTEDGTDIFGLELVDMHEPCVCCGDVITEWLAFHINLEKRSIGYGCVTCHDYESVKDSLYRGNSLYMVRSLIEEYTPEEDYE